MVLAVDGMIRRVVRQDLRVGSGENKDRHKGPMERGIRVDDDLWTKVKAQADEEGLTLNEYVVRLLEDAVS